LASCQRTWCLLLTIDGPKVVGYKTHISSAAAQGLLPPLSLSLSPDLLDMHDIRWKDGKYVAVSIPAAQLGELDSARPIVVPRLLDKVSVPTLAGVLR
jgi:hypothetical protein